MFYPQGSLLLLPPVIVTPGDLLACVVSNPGNHSLVNNAYLRSTRLCRVPCARFTGKAPVFQGNAPPLSLTLTAGSENLDFQSTSGSFIKYVTLFLAIFHPALSSVANLD